MPKYILKRILRSFLTMVIVITVVFSLLRLMPIEGYFENYDKLSQTQIDLGLQKLGLTDPLPKQLWSFGKQLLSGDLGVSIRYRKGVSIVIIQAVPAAAYHILIQFAGSQGVIHFGDWSLKLPMLFKLGDYRTYILPILSLAIGNIAYYAMWLRRYMVDEANKDYIKLARAKGVPSRQISRKHVFRNAMVPLIQYIPNSILFTLMGSLYVESLYSIPGMGGLLVAVIKRQDNNMVLALVVIYSIISILGLLFGDLLMALLDPRITLSSKEESR